MRVQLGCVVGRAGGPLLPDDVSSPLSTGRCMYSSTCLDVTDLGSVGVDFSDASFDGGACHIDISTVSCERQHGSPKFSPHQGVHVSLAEIAAECAYEVGEAPTAGALEHERTGLDWKRHDPVA